MTFVGVHTSIQIILGLEIFFFLVPRKNVCIGAEPTCPDYHRSLHNPCNTEKAKLTS